MNTLIMLNSSPYLLGFHEIILISPRISPDNTKVAYVEFRHNIYIYIYVSTIFIGHLHTGYEYCLDDLKGTAFAPRFSNDWKKDEKGIIVSIQNRSN